MTGSRRTTILPSDWRRIRARVLWRDRKICQIQGPDCAYSATEVDHIGRSDVHDLANLQSVCRTCHAAKTKRQAAIGRRNQAQARVAAKYRTPEPHPGLIRPPSAP